MGYSSITDLLRTVFVLVRNREQDYLTILLSAAEEFQYEIPGLRTYRPGMFGLKWSEAELKEVLRLYRDLGYKIAAYRESTIKSWFDAFETIQLDEQSANDPYELTEIVGVLPECHTYVEVFGGGAPMLYARAPSAVEVVNDAGSFVIDFLRVLRDPDKFVCFYLMSRFFPAYDPLDQDHLRKYIRAKNDVDDVVRAYAWYCYVRQVYLYAVKNNVPSETHALIRESVAASPLDGSLSDIMDTLSAVDPLLIDIHGRLFRVQYENNSWEKILDIYDTPGTLFWVDPVEYGPEAIDTGELLLLIKRLESMSGMVAFYYNHAECHPGMPEALERLDNHRSGWSCVDFETCTVFMRNTTTTRRD